jgi:hypothetical protein
MAEVEDRVVDRKWDDAQGHKGYDSWHYFTIQDQFGAYLPTYIELNEKWTEAATNEHTPPTTWQQVAEGAWRALPCPFAVGGGDPVVAEYDPLSSVRFGYGAVPNTLNPQTPLRAEKVYSWTGEHYVGSLTRGLGVKVLTKKWRYYTDHARREPLQP